MSDTSHPESPASTQTAPSAPEESVHQPHDFRQASLLSPRQMQALRTHQTQFIHAVETRLAQFLRSEFPLKLSNIQVVPYQKLTEGWMAPTHLVLFKTEPLRGVSLMEIPLRLGLTMVDRLMGGSGRVGDLCRELSEIEKALLDQIVQIILDEWCNNWTMVKPLKPALLGSETNGRFLQTAPPQTNMLTLTIDASLVDCTGKIMLAFPYAVLEPSLRQLGGKAGPPAETPAPAVPAQVPWNRHLDEVALPVTAEWQGMELSARELLHLKVGDVVQVTPRTAQQVCVRLGEATKFHGRLGTMAGQWAVELTRAAKA